MLIRVNIQQRKVMLLTPMLSSRNCIQDGSTASCRFWSVMYEGVHLADAPPLPAGRSRRPGCVLSSCPSAHTRRGCACQCSRYSPCGLQRAGHQTPPSPPIHSARGVASVWVTLPGGQDARHAAMFVNLLRCHLHLQGAPLEHARLHVCVWHAGQVYLAAALHSAHTRGPASWHCRPLAGRITTEGH